MDLRHEEALPLERAPSVRLADLQAEETNHDDHEEEVVMSTQEVTYDDDENEDMNGDDEEEEEDVDVLTQTAKCETEKKENVDETTKDEDGMPNCDVSSNLLCGKQKRDERVQEEEEEVNEKEGKSVKLKVGNN